MRPWNNSQPHCQFAWPQPDHTAPHGDSSPLHARGALSRPHSQASQQEWSRYLKAPGPILENSLGTDALADVWETPNDIAVWIDRSRAMRILLSHLCPT